MKSKKKRILYVEDDKIDRLAFERLAKNNDFPFQYNIVGSIPEAEKILKTNNFDCVLVDYLLGRNTAFDLFHILTETPFIIITGTGDQEIAVEAMKKGAYDYIIKDPHGKHLQTIPISIEKAIKHKQTKDELKKHQEQLEDLVKTRTQELLKEKEFTDSAINTQIDTFFVFDPVTGKPIRWNSAFTDISGYTDEEIATMKAPYNWYNKDDLGRAAEGTEKVFKEGQAVIEMNLITKTGKSIPFEYNASLIKDQHGKPKYIISIGRDISERKKGEIAIQESEENFRTLVENAFDGITINDIDGNYIYANNRAAEISGYSITHLTKMNVKDLTPDAVYTTIEQRIKKRIKNESGSEYYEGSLVMRNGKITPIELVAAKTLWKGEPVEMVFFRDISKRKKDEAELFKAKEKAEESDRLKSAFLANMSHEIRTPMNAIVGFANLLKDDSLEQDKINQFIDIINAKSEHLLNLIDDIIDISRIEADEVKIENRECSLNNLIDELQSSFQSELINRGKSKIELRTAKVLDDELSIVLCDETRLRQVLSNFLGNAIKFTDTGFIEIGYKIKNRSSLEFWVKDSGIGIPKYKQKLIFDRFRQADESLTRKYGGTGLGLAISKRLVELMGGEIGLDSTKWKGSTFYFTIPYKRSSKTIKSKTRMEKEDEYIWINKKILIVEDDIASSQLFEAILKKTQAEIIQIDTGEEAIEIFKSNKDIDLVLMDIQLPKIDGYQVIKEFKKLKPEVTIIAETAHAMKEDRKKSLDAGCDDYLTKPINLLELMKILNKYLG